MTKNPVRILFYSLFLFSIIFAIFSICTDDVDADISGSYKNRNGLSIDWSIDNDGNLVISGNGGTYSDIYPHPANDVIYWDDYKELVRSVSISDEFTNGINLSNYPNLVEINSNNLESVFAPNCPLLESVTSNRDPVRIDVRNCISLKYIYADSISVGAYAFENCTNYVGGNIIKRLSGSYLGSYYIYSSVEEYAFYGCSSIESMRIMGISSISKSAFELCTSLGAITTNGEIEIGEDAFAGCSSLESITCAGSVDLCRNAFAGCSNLTDLNISSISTVGTHTFTGCDSLTTINVPIKVIEERGFEGCLTLEYVALDSKTVIGPYSFYNCIKLNGDFNLTDVGSYSFYNCISLVNVTLNGVVNEGAFYGCSGLETIMVNSDVTTIADNAFYGCSKLNAVSLPYKTVNLGKSIFKNCKNLSSVILSERTVSIPSGMFDGCTSLTSAVIPFGVQSIGDYAFRNCTGISYLELPASVVSIGEYAFYNCGGISGSVIIPELVSSISANAFANCKSLTVLEIKSSILEISSAAFDSCSSLDEVSFDYEVNVCDGAFSNCGFCYIVCSDGYEIGSHINTDLCYSYQTFLVRFLMDDGSVLSYGTYHYSDNIIVPLDPYKGSDAQYAYSFIGWFNYYPGIHVSQDTDFVAIFSKTVNKYTITWQNYDGTVLEIQNDLEYGSMPAYSSSTPLKVSDEDYVYLFSGWSPVVSSVVSDQTYIAYFEGHNRFNTVIWKNYDGTVLEVDEGAEYGSLPVYDGTVPTRERTAQYTFSFLGWSPSLESIEGDAVYFAEYSQQLNEYTVQWRNHDGSLIEIDSHVEYGTMPSYDGVVPQKEPTKQHTFTFDYWSPTISEVKGDVTYTAVYSSILNRYSVIWKNDDNTTLETDLNVEYGTMPSYDGITPVKAPTAEYVFIFSDWSPIVDYVTGNVTYFASYNQFDKYCTIVWKNYDGAILETDTDVEFGTRPMYDGPIPTKEPTLEYAYSFSNWSPSISSVTGDVTYVAVFDQYARYSSVIWRNYDGTVLETDAQVEFGYMPVYDGPVPTRVSSPQYSYTFSNWSPSITPVTGNVTYVAVYSQTVNKYAVSWKNYDGTVLENDVNVDFGTTPSYDGSVPVKASSAQFTYSFSGWSPTLSPVSGNVTYTALFTEVVNSYSVVWKNGDVVLEIDEAVNYGSIPKYDGSLPSKASDPNYSYTFSGWSPSIGPVTGNVIYSAIFTSGVNKYTVLWKNYDGSILEVDESVEYGTIPSYDGPDPTKPSNNQYTYAFRSWSPAVSKITGDITYTAIFSETINKYTIVWKNEDGATLETDLNVEYGTLPSYDGSVPTKDSTAQYTYTFSNWSPVVDTVSNNAVYVAVFESTVNCYTVTWYNYDNSILEQDVMIPYGTLATYDGLSPVRLPDNQYTYSFSGWSPTISMVSCDMAYMAQYGQRINTYDLSISSNDINFGTVNCTSITDMPYGTKISISGNVAIIGNIEIIAQTNTNSPQFTYSFVGWSIPDQYEIHSDLSLKAIFSKTENKYTVLWNNYDGSLLERDDNVAYGSIPKYDGLDPVRMPSAQYSYRFVGWNSEISSVSANVTYTAVFEWTINSYTVVWKNYDGVTIETDVKQDFGSLPSFDGIAPVKKADAQYSYLFSGWSPAVSSVESDVSYTAVFTPYVNNYTIVWTNYDGTVLETDMGVPYGSTPSFEGATPSKPSDVQYSYAFSNWSPMVSKVTGDTTYTAVYSSTLNVYDITWKNYDGTVLESDIAVPYGTMASYDGNIPIRDATAEFTYSFKAWSPTISSVTGHMTYTAIFEQVINTYTVKIASNDDVYGRVSHSIIEKVPYGTIISVNGNTVTLNDIVVTAIPSDSGAQYTYRFASWSHPNLYVVTGTLSLVATFSQEVNVYNIVWKDYDGTVLETDMGVPYGSTPSFEGATPSKPSDVQYSYAFSNWSPMVSKVTGDTTYTAVYSSTLNVYDITWKNYDGTVLESDIAVPYGTMASYDGNIPIRDATAEFTYSFKAWSPTISSVTGHMTYTAIFEQVINTYTVKIASNNDAYGRINHSMVENVPYGSLITVINDSLMVEGITIFATSEINTKQYSYNFKYWSVPDQYPVTGDVIIKAIFVQSVNTYKVTWKNYDGTTLEVDAAVPFGSLPSYDGSTPNREMSDRHIYSFSNWYPTVDVVEGDVTYVANMTESPRLYDISFNLDGSPYHSSKYRFDELIILPSEPTRGATIAYEYIFSGWSGYTNGMVVSGNHSFDAQFESERIVYSITFIDSDGSRIVRNYTYGDLQVDEPDPYAHAPKGCVASWEDYSLLYDNTQIVKVKYVSYLEYTDIGASAIHVAGLNILGSEIDSNTVSVVGVNGHVLEWFNHLTDKRYIEIPEVTLDGKPIVKITNISNESITEIKFGQNIQDIVWNAFVRCNSLVAFTVSDSTHYTSLGGALLTNSERELVAVPYAIGEVFTIPDTVNTVREGAFSGQVKKIVIDTRNSNILFDKNANMTGKDIVLEIADESNVISISSTKLTAANSSVSLEVESRDFFGENSDNMIVVVSVILVMMVALQIISALFSKTIGNKNAWLFLVPVVISSFTMFIYIVYESISLQTDTYFTVVAALWLISTFVELGAAFYAFLCANRSRGSTTIRKKGRGLTIMGAVLSLVTALSMVILSYSGLIHVVDGLSIYLVIISISTAFTAMLGIIASRKIFSDVQLEQNSVIDI